MVPGSKNKLQINRTKLPDKTRSINFKTERLYM